LFPALVLAFLSPLHFAHSHNDYERGEPLFEALERGFVSIEADVFLREGRLLVGHEESDLETNWTLETLYLDPLSDWIREQGGSVFRDRAELMLVVDIKSEADSTYRELEVTLNAFRDILRCTEDGIVRPGPVHVILSGQRPWNRIVHARSRCASLEGRFADLASELSAELLPVIADDWNVHFTWRADPDFEGPLSQTEREKLRDFVRRAHEKGRKVRLWNTPDNELAWRELRSADVDLISTNRPKQLSRFLRASTPK